MMQEIRPYGLSIFALVFSSIPEITSGLQILVLIATLILLIIQIYQKLK